MIAAREAWQSGLLAAGHWPRNVVSGIVVGLVALPLAMAFAIASGVKPEQGIYTAIVAGALVSLLGGSRVQIAGPTGAFIVILAEVTRRHGVDGLQIATIMAGILLIVFGVLRLGTVIKYIPDSVIVGFTSGIAVIIWVGQWKDFFGLSAPAGEHFHQKLFSLLQMLPQTHAPTAGLALFALLVLIVSPRLLPKVPAPLVALVLGTLIARLMHLNVATIGTAFGGIPAGLPSLQFPEITPSRLVELVRPAFAIALLGSIESLLSAVVADGMAGTRHDSNQELIGQGIANLVAPLFGGFAATGAIARTATNIRNGGSSPIAGVVHSLLLILVLLVFAPLAEGIPLCVLAAILFVVAWNMAELHHFMRMTRRAPRTDVFILLTTFTLTVFVDLVVAVNIGVILAALLFMQRMSTAVAVQSHSETDLHQELSAHGLLPLPRDVLVYSIDGPFFFGAVETFERALGQTHTDPKVLILRMGGVPFVDVTGLQALEEAIGQLRKRGIRVVVCELTRRAGRQLQRAELLPFIGKDNVFATLVDAVRAVTPPGALAPR
jgi:sulfate permease, SulP family